MSTIKLELTVDANNIEIVTEFLGRIAVASVGGKKINDIKVDDAEEVKAEEVKAEEAEKPAPKPRPSRAKAKPQPEPEEEDKELVLYESDEDGEYFDDEGLEDEAEEETIDADDLRAKQAEKVAVHRATIKAKLQELGATGIKDLDEKHYAAYFDFLSKLK